jgi:hypothetical protein
MKGMGALLMKVLFAKALSQAGPERTGRLVDAVGYSACGESECNQVAGQPGEAVGQRHPAGVARAFDSYQLALDALR